VTAPERQGVTLHAEGRAQPGYNFYTSGHAPEAFLMDNAGNVLHRWRRDFLDVWPDAPRRWLRSGGAFWRRAHLFENGDILAIFEGVGIIKLDKDSNLLWARSNRAHHDLQVMPNGDIYVLTRKAEMVPRIDPDEPVLHDFISVLDPDGNEKRRISVLEALERSEFRDQWDPAVRMDGDLFHTNTLSVLGPGFAESMPAFREGNVLLSLLVPDLLAAVDLDSGRVVWVARGAFRKQHDPKLLPNGRLLLFDNRGALPHSRVLELDPGSPDDPKWQFAGSERVPFFSKTCGTAERLANGNTLITESDGGRAFEVTSEKEIVWEFYNPHRAGPENQLIATLFEVVRLPQEFPVGWAQAVREAAIRAKN
jgi:hypothetical protein